MEKKIEAMKRSILFRDIEEGDMQQIITCFGMNLVSFDKGKFILHQGDRAENLAMVVEGKVHVVKEDFLGNRDILTEVGPGEIFAEVYAILQDQVQSVGAIAVERTEVAFFSAQKLITPCGENCPFHHIMIKNMLLALARKNLILTRKIEHLSKKGIRPKLISYLSEQSSRWESNEFVIPFDRQQLADYLAVDRSALSRELAKMRRDRLIDYERDRFTLYAKPRMNIILDNRRK